MLRKRARREPLLRRENNRRDGVRARTDEYANRLRVVLPAMPASDGGQGGADREDHPQPDGRRRRESGRAVIDDELLKAIRKIIREEIRAALGVDDSPRGLWSVSGP